MAYVLVGRTNYFEFDLARHLMEELSL